MHAQADDAKTATLRELRQPDTSPGDPPRLPASAAVIELRAPILRPEAVREVQKRTRWNDEELGPILGGMAYAARATGRPVRVEHVGTLAHPAFAANQTDFVSGPVLVAAWIGAGALTLDRLYVPAQELRRAAIPEDMAEGDDPDDVFEVLWRQVRAQGWTAASADLTPLGSPRLAVDAALFKQVFIARTFGVQAILHAAGLAPTPRPPTLADDFLDWPRQASEIAALVEAARASASTLPQRDAVRAATSTLHT